MRQFKSFQFGKKQVTAIHLQEDGEHRYLWIAFNNNGDGTCDLRKVDAGDFTQIYADITGIDCNRINDMTEHAGYLYLAVDDEIRLGYYYSLSAPLITNGSRGKTLYTNESPIRVVYDGTYSYFLTPGLASGEPAKIIKTEQYNMSIDTVIDLQISGDIITNAIGITVNGALASGGSLWVVTGDNPAKLARVFEASGGGYSIQITDLL